MKNIQKTFGTRKQYKPGQLLTIGKDVVRVSKLVQDVSCTKCYAYGTNLLTCTKCYTGKIPKGCYLKLVKSIRVELHQP